MWMGHVQRAPSDGAASGDTLMIDTYLPKAPHVGVDLSKDELREASFHELGSLIRTKREISSSPVMSGELPLGGIKVLEQSILRISRTVSCV